MEVAQIVPAAVLAGLMISAIRLDSAFRTLPNWLCLGTLASGLATSLYAHGIAGAGSNLLHAAIVLVVMMGIYAMRMIGAGDAKFYAACAAWFPLSQAGNLLVWISALGLLTVLSWLVVLRIRRRGQTEKRRDGKFPLGVPIALGTAAAFLFGHIVQIG